MDQYGAGAWRATRSASSAHASLLRALRQAGGRHEGREPAACRGLCVLQHLQAFQGQRTSPLTPLTIRRVPCRSSATACFASRSACSLTLTRARPLCCPLMLTTPRCVALTPELNHRHSRFRRRALQISSIPWWTYSTGSWRKLMSSLMRARFAPCTSARSASALQRSHRSPSGRDEQTQHPHLGGARGGRRRCVGSLDGVRYVPRLQHPAPAAGLRRPGRQ